MSTAALRLFDAEPTLTLDTVRVGDEYRVVGAPIPAEELEALERAHENGDIRAEVRLRLLRTGRP